MAPPQEILLLIAIGVISGIVNTVAGGGTLIVLPALMAWGMPIGVANGTNRVAVLAQSAMGAFALRGVKARARTAISTAFVPACIGSAGGAAVAAVIPGQWLEPIVTGVLIVLLITLVWQPERWLRAEADRAEARPWVQRLIFLGIGFYGGFLQAGIGILLLAAFTLASGRDLVQGNRLKVLIVGILTVPALAVFVWNDLVMWTPGLILAIGSVVGSLIGSRLTLSWGPPFVRWFLVFAVAGLLLYRAI